MSFQARSEGSGVEVVVESLSQSDRPQCPHGPTILFERFCNNSRKRFYACSSCRDRKECGFYQNEDDKVSETTLKTREKFIKDVNSSLCKKEDYKRLTSALKQPESERRFCRTCHLLLTAGEAADHEDHRVLTEVTDNLLTHPTLLLAPLENNKANAQYLFSEKTNQFVVDTLDALGFTHVLCVGTPRVHEALGDQRSLLLDIDSRFHQFYNESQFLHYNMFNHHLFGSTSSEAAYRSFLSAAPPGQLAVLADPPFGGLVDLLSHTLNTIKEDFTKLHSTADGEAVPAPAVLWFFPYFMEPRVTEKCPDFTMLDYKVDYSNHDSFQGGAKGRKHGSPVRIFTNLSPARVVLPTGDGYKFCEDCQKYVSQENQHCKICKACTSKDGKTYVHCDVCEQCFKPSRVHCFKCEMCLMPDHTCGQRPGAGCHLCGDLTHKRRDCPLKDKPHAIKPIKRLATSQGETLPKKPRGQQTGHNQKHGKSFKKGKGKIKFKKGK